MKNQFVFTLLAAALSFTSLSHAADATLEAAAKEAGAVVTSSGLVYRSLKDGTGNSPKASDTVRSTTVAPSPMAKSSTALTNATRRLSSPWATSSNAGQKVCSA